MTRQIQEVGPEILQHAEPLLPPRADEVADGSVPVEEPRVVEPSEGARFELPLETDDQRFEAKVVRGAPDGMAYPCHMLELVGFLGTPQQERLVNQRMF